MNRPLSSFLLVCAGAIAGAIAMQLVGTGGGDGAAGEEEAKPLYWVAPMDPNYRRDGPGKSPMGMDLVPVYADDAGGDDSGPGTVRISPEVVNNLGVRTARVKSGRLPTVVRTVGNVVYDEDHMQHIHSRVEGWVERLHIKAEGDPVTRGAPLYDLYSPQLVNAQEELLLALSRNNERLVRAAKARMSALQFSAAAIDRLVSTRKVAQNVTVYAPQSGVIDNLKVREGFFVKPDMTMMSIAQLDPIWVVGEVFERQAGLVALGDSVQMQLDYVPSQSWAGQVDYIYPSLNPQTRTAQVRMRFDNPDLALKPNMYAQLEIQTRSRAETLLVPRESLIRLAGQDRVVLALGDGRFKSVAVKLGQVGDHDAEVREGLKSGDEIVVSAQFLLDSESSKSSDFKRMGDEMTTPPPSTAWTDAEVRSLPENGKISMHHQPIEAWNWPAMTMDFRLAAELDRESLVPGKRLAIKLEKTPEGAYQIVELAPAGNDSQLDQAGSPNPAQSNQGDMDHGAMDHGEMNHGDMDHSQMDHAQMNHGEMDHGQMDHEQIGHDPNHGDQRPRP